MSDAPRQEYSNPWFKRLPSIRGARVGIRRSQGKSFTELIAYICGVSMKDERTGTWYTGRHPRKVIGYVLTAPQWAPSRLTDRAQLPATVIEIEQSEKLVNSHVGEYWTISGNSHFDELDHFAVLGAMAEELTYRYRVWVVGGIHAPAENDEDQRLRYHIGFNMREVTPEGFGKKVVQINGKWTRRDEWQWVRRMFDDIVYDRFQYLGEAQQTFHQNGEAEIIDLDDMRDRRRP